MIGANTKGEVGESGRARECVAALRGIASIPVLVIADAIVGSWKLTYYEAPETCL